MCIGFGVRRSGPFSCYSSPRLLLRKDSAHPFPSQKLEKGKGQHSHYSPVNQAIGQATSYELLHNSDHIFSQDTNCLKCQPFSLFPSDGSQTIPVEADPFQVRGFTVVHGTDLHFSVNFLKHLSGVDWKSQLNLALGCAQSGCCPLVPCNRSLTDRTEQPGSATQR